MKIDFATLEAMSAPERAAYFRTLTPLELLELTAIAVGQLEVRVNEWAKSVDELFERRLETDERSRAEAQAFLATLRLAPPRDF